MLAKKHPRLVPFLLLVHTLERFGFWGMRSLFVLYLIEDFTSGGLAWSEADAIAWNGIYGGLLYVTPTVGGWLADQWMGPRRAILLGSGLMAMGIFFLAAGRAVYFFPLPSLLPVLVCLSLGNGLFKPCVTSLLGQLYDCKDNPSNPLREKGYQYLYQTVLIGIVASGFICGWLQPRFGFPIAFGVAAAAVMVAMGITWMVPRSFWPQGDRDASRLLQKEGRGNIQALCFLMVFAVLFFALHSQGGGLFTVFVHRHIDRIIFDWEVPTLWVTTSGTFFGIVLTPVLVALWTAMRNREREPSSFGKMALGMSATGIAFLFLLGASWHHSEGGAQGSLLWLVGYHLTYMLGKLCIMPVLWSTAEKLAPSRHRYVLMGVVMGCISLGYILGGQVGNLIESMCFVSIFGGLSAVCLVIALFLACFSKVAI